MLKILGWLEIMLAIILLALALWPFSGYCSGRFMGLDCESRAIFGVNMFGPLGILAIVCSTWSLKGKSIVPQYVLVFGVMLVIAYWWVHTL